MTSIATLVDCDRIASEVLADVTDAAKGWLRGRPTDEIAFLNRLTENLNKHRRGCDVGVVHPVIISNRIYMLHRQSKNNSDLFGADLAVSLYAKSRAFLKTAFIQLKKCEKFKLELKRKQLNASQYDPRIAPNSFVLAVDETRIGCRVESVQRLLCEFDLTQDSKSFDATTWMFLTDWLLKWLTDNIGVSSDPATTSSIESQIRKLVISQDFNAPWIQASEKMFDENEPMPARAWLVVSFDG